MRKIKKQRSRKSWPKPWNRKSRKKAPKKIQLVTRSNLLTARSTGNISLCIICFRMLRPSRRSLSRKHMPREFQLWAPDEAQQTRKSHGTQQSVDLCSQLRSEVAFASSREWKTIKRKEMLDPVIDRGSPGWARAVAVIWIQFCKILREKCWRNTREKHSWRKNIKLNRCRFLQFPTWFFTTGLTLNSIRSLKTWRSSNGANSQTMRRLMFLLSLASCKSLWLRKRKLLWRSSGPWCWRQTWSKSLSRSCRCSSSKISLGRFKTFTTRRLWTSREQVWAYLRPNLVDLQIKENCCINLRRLNLFRESIVSFSSRDKIISRERKPTRTTIDKWRIPCSAILSLTGQGFHSRRNRFRKCSQVGNQAQSRTDWSSRR